ncbi:MAG: DUF3592 domain-containing protein [Gammaproteobacteria bacterium]|nr:DUF3592 domain-containing protein [Gammaproteobacteria bacterium]MBU1776408.1 DUF3592 domain-containing protein [Gammaproteobacteria bacterium]MBU1969816.1 DUF3592 domain-containing protein [Gammaproteobacteria bacterium]
MRFEIRKRSWLFVIFGFPFFAVGIYFLFTTAHALYDVMRMATWPQTQGELTSANLGSSTSDNTTTYRATAQYRYRVGGIEYAGDRVAIHGGGDNIGKFQQRLGSQLELMYLSRQPVTVYYNADDPADAVLNRDMRLEMLGFKMIFVIVFGGAGLGLIILGYRGKRTIVSPETAQKPWLARPEWADNRIRSTARTGMYAIWFFAVIWNALSLPTTFVMQDVWQKEGALALIILLFPLVGLGLLSWAIKLTREWRRFGVTPLSMDPFPGAIGGDVGGEIELRVPYQPALACEVTLSCLYSYESGSGEDRSQQERVEWQDSGYAQVEPTAQGMRLRFRFAVPAGLRPSEEETGDHYFWRLSIKAKSQSGDLDRSFTIPVYATAEQSRFLQLDTGKTVPPGAPEMKAESLLPLRRNGTVQELYYPMFRQPKIFPVVLLVGIIFAITGIFLWGKAVQQGGGLYFMGGIFTFLGSVATLIGFYIGFNSYYVAWDGQQVLVIRRLLGMTVRRRLADYRQVRAVELKKGATSNQQNDVHQINYHVVAHTTGGEMVLAENIDSHSKAKLVESYFREQLGLNKTPGFMVE